MLFQPLPKIVSGRLSSIAHITDLRLTPREFPMKKKS